MPNCDISLPKSGCGGPNVTQFATLRRVFKGATSPQAGACGGGEVSAELQAVGERQRFEVGAVDLFAGNVEIVGKGRKVLVVEAL